jgi:NAD(P)-dependent dehydrogenase (short-subunit alcohol dehydrogenase family)
VSINLDGKTCLITGSTSGIGQEAAVALARLGARVVLTARDAKKGAAALADVKQRSGSEKVELMFCDFSSQQDIRRFAEEFRKRHDALHILVNNAGAVNASREVTADGFEKTWATNHLGYFLLTNLLLDLLVASAPARIVNVSSEGHRRGAIDFDNLQFEKGGYQVMTAYSRSKLANNLFTAELSRRVAGKGVTVNALHPGVVATNIWSRAPFFAKPVLAIAKLFFITPEEGSRTIVYLASSPEVEETTGQYFIRNKPVRWSRLSHDESLAKKVWEVSEQQTGLAGAARITA